MTHRAKKHLGQNFLTDRRALQKIVEGAGLIQDDIVVEIGPGQGAMTRLVAPLVKQLICVEKDQDLIQKLQDEFGGGNVIIIHADFLKWNLPEGIKVMGNIPYYISTPIVEKLIESRSKISQAYLTVQLEFGQRMAAKAASDDYGALSCFAQYYADVEVLFKIKNTCFNPKPKVDSCFVKMDFARPMKYHPKNEELMFKLIRTSFTQRRKNILNAAETVVVKDKMTAILENLNISPKIRPEDLNLDNFVAISNALDTI